MSEVVATNRKAKRDYEIKETLEAGIVLKGNEVKSVREHRVGIKDSFARVEGGEVFLYNLHISPYEKATRVDLINPTRERKLLLHKSEIIKLGTKVQKKGLTLIPLKIYLKSGVAKVELALAKGKRKYDKRQKIKRKIHQREIDKLK